MVTYREACFGLSAGAPRYRCLAQFIISSLVSVLVSACDVNSGQHGGIEAGGSAAGSSANHAASREGQNREYYGSLEPFTAEAVYFAVTDRFVNGDPTNDQREQGGAFPSFDRPLAACDGISANVGYLGGDFKGLLNHADYIREMGFSALWITPIVANPDQSFSGGDPIRCSSILSDQGKAAYHGYWGANFFQVDEHWPSVDLSFAQFTQALKEKGLKTVLDIVGNHSSPAWGMRAEQAADPSNQFGKVYAADGSLLADHHNLEPVDLNPADPLQHWYNGKPDLAQLGDFNADNPLVLDYLVAAYSQWIEQGAAAFRIDTIAFQPHNFWHAFSRRIRARHPGFFMFAEAFDYEAAAIAPHTWAENADVSVLDFPLRERLAQVFENPGSDFAQLEPALHLTDGLYRNPYELATFYDNHDMARLNASNEGFIDVHNWLFTARGIPVVYYGSEMGFMRGRAEHAGNRNYFGEAGIAAARQHPIRQALSRIAQLRQASPALQRGLQLNIKLAGEEAVFYRVFQHAGLNQTALVLLNKGDKPAEFSLTRVPVGSWRNAWNDVAIQVPSDGRVRALVPAHGVQVFFFDQALSTPELLQALDLLMQKRERPA